MSLCGIVLAAGRGTRLAPFSDHRPKASFPIGTTTLLGRALDTLRPHVDELAVNVCGFAGWFEEHVPDDVTTFVERPDPYGTAGALVNMRSWIDGRDVAVLNADAVLFGDVTTFLDDAGSAATRLLVGFDKSAPDFDTIWRFVGLSTMTQASLSQLAPDAEDLYRDLWKRQLASDDVELVPFDGMAVDCGRPADLLAANLIASRGGSVIEDGAVLESTAQSTAESTAQSTAQSTAASGMERGIVLRSVVLRGARVAAGDRYRNCVVGEDTVFRLDGR